MCLLKDMIYLRSKFFSSINPNILLRPITQMCLASISKYNWVKNATNSSVANLLLRIKTNGSQKNNNSSYVTKNIYLLLFISNYLYCF